MVLDGVFYMLGKFYKTRGLEKTRAVRLYRSDKGVYFVRTNYNAHIFREFQFN